MKILGLIPARGGSKGVVKKNVKVLGAQPLIAYTISAAKKSKLLSAIIVSTDSDEIYSIAESHGVKSPFLRPEHLAQDHSTSLEVVQHAVEFYEKQGVFFDAVCLLQPTNPFREKGFIDRAINRFIESGADSLVSVLPVPHEYNPHWVFTPDDRGFLKISTGEQTIIPRRQELPEAFHRDGSMYIARTSAIKNGSLFGNSIVYIESNPVLYVNIDTLTDWENAERLVKNPEIMQLID